MCLFPSTSVLSHKPLCGSLINDLVVRWNIAVVTVVNTSDNNQAKTPEQLKGPY